MSYAINWDLDSIFPGGSESHELKERMDRLSEQIHAYHEAVLPGMPQLADRKL